MEPTKIRSVRPLYLVFCAIVMCFIAVEIYSTREERLNELSIRVRNYASITEESIALSLEKIDVSLHFIANQVSNLPQKPNNEFNIELAQHRDFLQIPSLEIHVTNAEGKVVASSAGARPQEVSLGDREYFRILKNDKSNAIHITPVLEGRIHAGKIISIARRISSPNGKFLGVAVASISYTYFGQFLENLHFGANDLFTVATGTPLTTVFRYPDAEKYVGHPYLYGPTFSEVMNHKVHGKTAESISPKDKIRRISSFNWVKNYPVFFNIGINTNSILIPWQTQSLVFFSVTIFLLCLGYLAIRAYDLRNLELLKQQSLVIQTSKLAALGEMAASIAHEINNPLAIISGHVQRIKRISQQPQPPEVYAEISDKVILTISRITKIINGLRNFSRDGGSELAPIDFWKVIEDVGGVCGERLKVNGVSLTLPPQQSITILGNHVQLTQVFVNLINNSFDAMKDYPEKWIKILIEQTDSSFVIRFVDSGKGIPPELAQKIMEPFFTTKELGKGTGLGLSLSKAIIENHGGSFRLDHSYPNTCFVIQIPKISAKRVAA